MTSPRRRRLRPWPAPPLSSSIYPSFSLARTPSSSSSFLGPIWTGNRAVATKLLVRSPEPCRGSISEEVSPYTYLSPVSVSRTIVLTRFNVYTSHQKVVLEVDFSGSLWVSLRVLMSLVLCNTLPQGYTEITVVPTSKDLKAIHLHARQCGTCRSLAFDYARSAL